MLQPKLALSLHENPDRAVRAQQGSERDAMTSIGLVPRRESQERKGSTDALPGVNYWQLFLFYFFLVSLEYE